MPDIGGSIEIPHRFGLRAHDDHGFPCRSRVGTVKRQPSFWDVLKVAALVAVPVALYWRSRKGPLVFDDIMLPHDAVMKGDWPADLKRESRSLSYASMALNVRHFGAITASQNQQQRDRALFGFHIGNMALHSLNGLILWWVYRKLGRKNPWLSAMIFSVHPLASSSVGYISGRSAVLSGTFSFTAMGLMASSRPFASTIPFALACMAKEDSVPVAMALYAAGRHQNVKHRWVAGIPLVGAVLYKTYRRRMGALPMLKEMLSQNGDKAVQQCGFEPALKTPEYQATAFTELVRRLPFWMIGQRQSVDPKITNRTWKDPAVHASVLLTLMAYVAARQSRDTRLSSEWILGSPSFLYTLFPMPDPVLEYRGYFTTAGIAHGLGSITDRSPRSAIPLLAYFAIQTYRRNAVFADPLHYWQTAVDSGRQDRALINLGAEFLNNATVSEQRVLEDRARARAAFTRALEGNPRLALARGNIALMDRKEGKIEDASKGFAETVKYSPEHFQSWHYLGTCQEQLGQLGEAITSYQRANTIQDYAPAHNRLGIVAMKQNRLDDAIPCFRRASQAEPNNIEFRYNYALSLKLAGRMEEAIPIFKTLPKRIPVGPDMLVVTENKS